MLNRRFAHKCIWGLVLETPNLKSWKTAFLLSIIVPVSLLATFKLTGIIKEPITIVETMALLSKEWTFPRPTSECVDISQVMNAWYVDSQISSLITLEILNFHHGLMTWVPPGDSLEFALFINVSTSVGYVQSIEIVFCNDTQPSKVWIRETSITLENLTLTSFRWASSAEAFEKFQITLIGTNSPQEVGFKSTGEWFLQDVLPDAKDHHLEILCTLIYYEGATYKKIVQPFQLELDTSRHILNFDAAVSSNLPVPINIDVSVDDITYQTPFRIFVSEGLHRITFPQSFKANSTVYQFNLIIINDGAEVSETPDLALDVQEDMHFLACYKEL